jgi:RNA polymerase-binding transcription factor DksA
VALVALARLERDHVALLAALCDLETADSRHLSAAMRDALAVLLRADLRQTQHALALAAEGRYGACERCHTPLASVALLTTPATTRCPSCVGATARANQLH